MGLCNFPYAAYAKLSKCMSNIFALVDCNNFYASCEKLFRPDLKNTPVVVLSNNDGCIVARCAIAKAMGFKMGTPYFKVEADLRRHGVTVFSSNYALYADMSSRVMITLEHLAPEVEIYSIDEAFLNLTGMDKSFNLHDFGKVVRETVLQWTGITVCVGIAPTKTLAKLANHGAKKYAATAGVVDLTDRERQRRLLGITKVGEVWGVGKRIEDKLHCMGIYTALDLAKACPNTIRSRFSVTLERTLRELNGVSCMELETVAPTKQQIISSRSFGTKVSEIESMKEAISLHTVRACEKLREEKVQAKQLTVFIRSNQYEKTSRQYSASLTGKLVMPSQDSRDLIKLALSLLEKIWKSGYRYAKAGIMLYDFYPADGNQNDLFEVDNKNVKKQQLMQTLDSINKNTGKVFFAAQGIQRSWEMRRQYQSPAYTTNWRDLPIVK